MRYRGCWLCVDGKRRAGEPRDAFGAEDEIRAASTVRGDERNIVVADVGLGFGANGGEFGEGELADEEDDGDVAIAGFGGGGHLVDERAESAHDGTAAADDGGGCGGCGGSSGGFEQTAERCGDVFEVGGDPSVVRGCFDPADNVDEGRIG